MEAPRSTAVSSAQEPTPAAADANPVSPDISVAQATAGATTSSTAPAIQAITGVSTVAAGPQAGDAGLSSEERATLGALAKSLLDGSDDDDAGEVPAVSAAAVNTSSSPQAAEEDAGDDASSVTERYWSRCHVTEEQLDALAAEGLIPPKENGGWRSAFGETVPKPNSDERVMLTSHILRGLGFPPSHFFLDVCDCYGLQPHNLTPNSVLYIAGYQALFEGWLGLAPRLDFFKYVFQPRRQTHGKKGRKELAVCGTVSINLRRNRDWYPKVPKIDSVKDWTGTFFYCRDVPLPNRSFGIPPFQNIAGEERASWDEKPASPVPGELLLLQRRIEALTCREPELTGTDTVICWLKRRIQPCAFHGSRRLCEYTDAKDALRFTEADLPDKEYRWRVNQLITERTNYSESCPIRTAGNPVTKVCFPLIPFSRFAFFFLFH